SVGQPGTTALVVSGSSQPRRLILKTLPLIATLVAAGSASAAQVWIAPAAQKIRPGVQAPAGAATTARIAAAKNEFESFHVVVTGAASGVSMALEGLNDGNGHTIAGRDVVLYREALLNVPQQSGGDGVPGGAKYDFEMKQRSRYVQATLDNHVSIYAPYYTATVNASGAKD